MAESILKEQLEIRASAGWQPHEQVEMTTEAALFSISLPKILRKAGMQMIHKPESAFELLIK